MLNFVAAKKLSSRNFIFYLFKLIVIVYHCTCPQTFFVNMRASFERNPHMRESKCFWCPGCEITYLAKLLNCNQDRWS